MKYRNILTSFAAGAAFILAFWACNDTSSSYGGNPNPNPNPPANTVTMASSYYSPYFSPSTLTVSRGTTVTWKNNDSMTHTSTSNSGIWNTGNIPAGGSATTRFDSVGTFGFHCAIHASMTGTITVN